MGFFKWVESKVTQATNWAVGEVSQAVNYVADKVVKPVVKKIENTVKAIIADPLPYIAQVAGSMVGIPPYVTAAAITAARGGDLEDIAVSAAVSYAGSKAFAASGVGSGIGDASASAGDYTQSLIKDYGFSQATATVVGNMVQSGVSNAAVGGIRAALTGRDIGDGITTGFTQGAISSGTSSYFKGVQKDWGITPETAKNLASASSASLVALTQGKDPLNAINNYVAQATLKTAGSAIKTEANQLWKNTQEWAKKTEDSKSEYDKAMASYEASVADYQSKYGVYSQELQKYQGLVSDYDKQMAIYNDTSNSDEVRNAAADEANKIGELANTTYSDVKAKADEVKALEKNLSDPTVGIAKELKQTSDAVQANYDAYQKTLDEAKLADENYGKQLAEVATREAIIDSVNNGVIKTVENPDAPAGSITLENGLVITPDGKYLQDGKEVFANASGVEQNALDFKTDSGDHYVFDSMGNRITSDTDAQKLVKEQYGLDLSAEEAQVLVGSKYGQEDQQIVKTIAQEKIEEKFNELGYKAPSQEVVDSLLQPNTNVLESFEKFVDPYYIAEEEVKAFFNDTLGRDPTPEEMVEFIGAKSEAETLTERQAQEIQAFDNLTRLFGIDYATDAIPTDWKVEIRGFPDQPQEPVDDGTLDEVVVTDSPEDQLLEFPTATPSTVTPSTVAPSTPVNTTTNPLSLNLVAQTPKTPQTGTTTLAGLSATEQFPQASSTVTSAKPTFLSSKTQTTPFESVLTPLHQLVAQTQDFETQPETQQAQEPQIMDNSFYSYGQDQSIDDIMAMGQAVPQMATGGLAGTRYGRYAGGGMTAPLMAAGGKMRVDFRHGDAVTGEGDGQSDDIPAMLADGEFVFPADVVAAIGNGSTKAGSDKLYDMMHGIRAHVRSAKPQDLPPEIKSPLQFLKTKPSKARR
jgi:hypothetical protein